MYCVLLQEIYSTGPAERDDGEIVEQEGESIQYFSYTKEEHSEDEDDIHETKFLLRFLATNTDTAHRYMWVNDTGEVRTDGGYTNIASKKRTSNLCKYLVSSFFFFFFFFFTFRLLSVLRGHSIFFIPTTPANDPRLRRIFYPRFYPLHFLSYLNS